MVVIGLKVGDTLSDFQMKSKNQFLLYSNFQRSVDSIRFNSWLGVWSRTQLNE